MASDEIWPKTLYSFILPIVLLTACLFRYNALSALYLLFLLVIPLLPSPSRRGSKCSVYLQSTLLCFSLVFIITHIIFQVVLLSYKPYGSFMKICTSSADISGQIGFYRFENYEVKDIIRLLAPDVIVFICSLVAVLSCRHITARSPQIEASYSSDFHTSRLNRILPIFVTLFLLVAGISQPNILSSVYFLAFLVLGICWAFHLSEHIQNSSLFFILKILLTVYAGLHVFLIYLYQLPFFQHSINPTQFLPRLLGLPAVIDTQDCKKSRELLLNQSLEWPFIVYPFMVLLLYWSLALDNRIKYRKHYNEVVAGRQKALWWHPKSWSKRNKETLPLIDGGETQHYGSVPIETNTALGDTEMPNQQPYAESDVPSSQTQSTFSSITMFFMRQSYIAALIIMMTWSILYHSWLTFVLLLWACLTWILPFARWFCMASSPYLVVYADLLLIGQYIYGMNLRDDELPIKEGKFDFSELGLVRYQNPVLVLGVQTIFTCFFMVTLRQHYHEKRINMRNSSEIVLTNIARPIMEAIRKRVSSGKSEEKVVNMDELDSASPPSDDVKEFMVLMKGTLAKYWILVCCAAFLLVALQNSVSLYQILYMVIFLIGFIIYQFSVRTWKTILRPLWWFMVVYSVVILLAIYTYQFDNMHMYWYNGTHLSDKWLYDLGLRQQSKPRLFVELLIPTIFSIIIVIQLHFFHKPLMMKLNRLLKYRKCKRKKAQSTEKAMTIDTVVPCDDISLGQPSAVTSSTGTVLTTMTGTGSFSDESDDEIETSLLKKMKKIYSSTAVILWRFAEIHSGKLISFVVVLVVTQQISAINAVFIILLAISMPSSYLHRFMNYFMIVWSSIVVLVFMFYQLQSVDEDMLNKHCNNTQDHRAPQENASHFSSNAWWLGFHKSSAVSNDVRAYLFIVLVIVFEKVVKHHQELYRFRKNVEKPPTGILFADISRKMADKDVINCAKYLCNNFLRLFGMEINLMVMIICMSIRGDAVAVIHSLWLAIFLIVERKTSAKIWRFYVLYLAIFLPLQYLAILGWPPGLCKGYPWDDISPEGLVQWFYLTDVQRPQDQSLLLADYFMLLLACCQAEVFTFEALENEKQQSSPDNFSNTIFTQSHSEPYVPPDFMGNKTWLDFIKICILDQFLWLSLTIVYFTAQQTTSLFNSGFMVGCFFFLWHGQGLYLRKRKTMKRWWKIFIYYNFFVIVAKCWLQLVSCVYISSIYQQTDCYLVQLLNLYCLRSDAYGISPSTDEDCIAQYDSGVMMDSVCFIVALIQYRIFNSIYFKYVIREHRKQSEFAYKGAQLVEERLQVRLRESMQRDKKKMQVIKSKVAKLKQRLEQLNPKAQEPLTHYEAIYAGDYYLFEDSEGESESDIREEDSNDVTISTTPKQTSEHQLEDVSSLQESLQEDEEIEKEMNATHGKDIGGEQEKEADGQETSPTEGLRRRHPQKGSIVGDQTSVEILTPSPECTFDSNQIIDDDSETSKSCKEKMNDYLISAGLYFQDLANAATKFFNESSSDYRYITSQLALERKAHAKTQTDFSARGSGDAEKMEEENNLADSISSKDEESSDTWSVIATEQGTTESWKKTDSCSVRLAVAFYYALLANTDLLCYTLMIVNHMYYACVLSMPLPFFVFLWGMLSIPRPTKRFWITLITYVELVIVVKYIFQFQFPADRKLNFNECEYYDAKEAKSPLCPPKIIGIERNQYSSACDLLLLLALFFHRFALKTHGLWREKTFGDEEDTSPRIIPVITGDATDIEHAMVNQSTQDIDPNHTNDLTSAQCLPHRKASILHNIKSFIQRMLDPQVGTGAVDVYAWMFGAQFIVFVIILSSWSAFSSSQETKSNFAKIIEENNVPKTFLYMLLTQFLLIVFDRYLYMRKLVFVKLIYLAVLVFLSHIFLFVVVPDITQRPFVRNVPAMFMYIFQCIYFGLSAYQVRCGYPTRILGNFLTKNYTVTSGVLFQGIQSIPFLLELRSVLDWVCTQTTLTLNHWLKMEDIYANIFVMKCWRDSEKTWPQPRGKPYWLVSKWLVGGLMVFLLIVVIWFPLLLMSFINSAYISNRPVEVTFTLTVGGYQPLFKVSTQQQLLKELSSREINSMIQKLKVWEPKDKTDASWDTTKIEQGFQDYKTTGTIVRIKVLSNSSAIWTISPPSRDFLIKDLESNSSISLRFKYVFGREPDSVQAAIVQETVSGMIVKPLPPGDKIRNDLAKALRNDSGDGEIEIPNLFPTFMQVPASGPVKPVTWIGGGSYVNCKLILRRGSAPHLNTTQVEWWDIVQEKPKPLSTKKLGYLEIISLNDLVPPLHLSFFANKGIIGLYVGFVWLVGKFVRLFFSSISYRIMFDELPNVDRVLKLCLEIYMVRESNELKLEEDLFAKLLFLYRSPKALIKWTKYKRFKTS